MDLLYFYSKNDALRPRIDLAVVNTLADRPVGCACPTGSIQICIGPFSCNSIFSEIQHFTLFLLYFTLFSAMSQNTARLESCRSAEPRQVIQFVTIGCFQVEKSIAGSSVAISWLSGRFLVKDP